jgi:hypothetical protein
MTGRTLTCFAIALGGWAAGCTKKVAEYCDEDTPCLPGQICDFEGEFAASDYISNTCIPSPYDAGIDAGRVADAGPTCSQVGESLRCEAGALVSCDATGHEVRESCNYGCSTDRVECNECSPSTQTCENSRVVVCEPNGRILIDETCAAGCFAGEDRCAEVGSSNSLDSYLDQAGSGPDVVLTGDATINTDSGVVMNGDSTTVLVPSYEVAAPSEGVPLRVFVVKSLAAEGIAVAGSQAVAIVSHDDIEISGIMTLGHRAGTIRDSSASCYGGFGRSANSQGNEQYSGGGGAGYRVSAAPGGDVTYAIAGGDGGAAYPNPDLVPLRGGCGAWPGGAVQLVSRTAIRFAPGSGINANAQGRNGGSGPDSQGGGSSGGGILLEAPLVTLGADAVLAANGSAGGALNPGEDGKMSAEPALGPSCSEPRCGDGGNGGTGSIAPTAGESVTLTTAESYQWGGGGGGAAGYIRINTLTGDFTASSSTVVSPPAGTGMIGLR